MALPGRASSSLQQQSICPLFWQVFLLHPLCLLRVVVLLQNREEGSTTPNLAEIPRVEMVPVRLARVAFSLGDYKKALHHLDFYLNTLSELTSDSQPHPSCVES